MITSYQHFKALESVEQAKEKTEKELREAREDELEASRARIAMDLARKSGDDEKAEELALAANNNNYDLHRQYLNSVGITDEDVKVAQSEDSPEKVRVKQKMEEILGRLKAEQDEEQTQDIIDDVEPVDPTL